MYKYVLNSAVKILMMFAKYFENYTIILKGAVFSWTRVECGPMPNVMAAQPNIGGTLCKSS